MAKTVLTVGLELKRYIQDFDSALQSALDKWQSQLKNLNDTIISRIKIRLGDGQTIDPQQYEQELASVAAEGYRAYVGIDKGNDYPMAVLGQLKHELRVKGGVFKYIDNVQAAFQVDPNTQKSYFMDRVDSAYQTGMIKRIFAALQVVGARYAQKTWLPAILMAMTGDHRYTYLVKNAIVQGENVAGYKVLNWDATNNQYVAGNLDDFLSKLPAFEPHHAPYVRPYTISAIVQRFHLAVAAGNIRETGLIDDAGLQNYLKTINTPFKNLASFKASSVSDVLIAYVDPLDSNFKPVDNWTDRKNKAAIVFCVATGNDNCSDVRQTYMPS